MAELRWRPRTSEGSRYSDIRWDWQRPRPAPGYLRRDAVVALALLAGALLSNWLYTRAGFLGGGAETWWYPLLWAPLLTLPLSWRRRFPMIVGLIVTVTFVAGQLAGLPEQIFSNIVVFLAFYSIGAWARHRRAAFWLRLAIIIGMFGWLLGTLGLQMMNQANPVASLGVSEFWAWGLISILMNLLYFGAAFFFGEAAFRSAVRDAELTVRTAELAAARERNVQQAVALEQVRIARELHDIVAHHVSTMGIQAAAARRLLAVSPERAEQPLISVEKSARKAIEELHILLTALRKDDHLEIAGAPAEVGEALNALRIEHLENLVSETRAVGQEVELRIVGQPRDIPQLVHYTAYRVVQEALTNIRKHTGYGASARVSVRYLTDEVEVSDNGGQNSRAAASDTLGGLGLRGMRERVHAVGGELATGPKNRGGFLVRARLPAKADESG